MQHTNAAHNRRRKKKIKIKNDDNWLLRPLLQKIKTQNKLEIPPPQKKGTQKPIIQREERKKRKICALRLREKKKKKREKIKEETTKTQPVLIKTVACYRQRWSSPVFPPCFSTWVSIVVQGTHSRCCFFFFFSLSFFHRVYAFLFRRCCCYCCFASM